MILWIFIIMLGLFAIGLPVAWSMAMAAAVYMVLGPRGLPSCRRPANGWGIG